MRSNQAAATNVIRFPGPRAAPSTPRDQRGLLDTVYTSGALVVGADDRATKAIAARLQVFGFLNIAEVSMDGSARRLKASEASAFLSQRPWRLSRPSFDELAPILG